MKQDCGDNQGFVFGHAKCEMFVNHPKGEVEQEVGYIIKVLTAGRTLGYRL